MSNRRTPAWNYCPTTTEPLGGLDPGTRRQAPRGIAAHFQRDIERSRAARPASSSARSSAWRRVDRGYQAQSGVTASTEQP